MKKQLGLLALMTVLISGMVYAVCVCTFDQTATTTATSTTFLRGTAQNLSVTMSGCNNTNPAYENASRAYLTVSTGTISGALLFESINQSANHSYMNTTVNTLQLKDDGSAGVYTFTMNVYNGSNNASLATCTRVYRPDNTVPVCSFDSAFISGESYNPDQKWTITGTNASTGNIRFGSNRWWTLTQSPNDAFSFKDEIPEGIYTVQAATSDDLNTTICTELTFVRIDSGSTIRQVGGALATTEGAKTTKKTGNNALAMLVIFGIAIIGYKRLKQ